MNGLLQTNSYLVVKTICALLVSTFLVSPFSVQPVFSVKAVFEHVSLKKDLINQIIGKWPPKSVFVDLLKKYLVMNAGLWSRVCVWFSIFENFFEDFCDVCERESVWNRSYYKWPYWLWVFPSYFYWVIKNLIWSVCYYHGKLADIERWGNGERLVAYGFHSWQINWYLTPRREK